MRREAHRLHLWVDDPFHLLLQLQVVPEIARIRLELKPKTCGCGSKFNHHGKTGLIHVSIYQGSYFGYIFFDPLPCDILKISEMGA